MLRYTKELIKGRCKTAVGNRYGILPINYEQTPGIVPHVERTQHDLISASIQRYTSYIFIVIYKLTDSETCIKRTPTGR